MVDFLLDHFVSTLLEDLSEYVDTPQKFEGGYCLDLLESATEAGYNFWQIVLQTFTHNQVTEIIRNMIHEVR